MKKLASIIVGLLFVSIHTYGQNPGIGKFYSNQKTDKVFFAALQAVSSMKFSVKSSDKENGVIQAEQYIIGGNGKVVNLFITVKEDSAKTVVETTFTKPFGTSGNMSKFAKEYGEEIKKTITDLDIIIQEKK